MNQNYVERQLGDSIALQITVADAITRQPINVSDFTLRVYAPTNQSWTLRPTDIGTPTYGDALTNPSVGVYQFQFRPDQGGDWYVTWVSVAGASNSARAHTWHIQMVV